MRVIHSWNDMQQYGVTMLTGAHMYHDDSFEVWYTEGESKQ